MKSLILIILSIFFLSYPSFAINEYFNCGASKVKISESLNIKSKIYVEKEEKWVEVSGKITEEKILITGNSYNSTCKSGPICDINWVILRQDIFGVENVVEEFQFAANACKKETHKICNSYNTGDLISKTMCIRMYKKIKI